MPPSEKVRFCPVGVYRYGGNGRGKGCASGLSLSRLVEPATDPRCVGRDARPDGVGRPWVAWWVWMVVRFVCVIRVRNHTQTHIHRQSFHFDTEDPECGPA